MKLTIAIAALLLMAAPQRPAKRFLNHEGRPKPPGYTHVVTSPPGRMIFISGQGGSSADGQMPEDFPSQTKNTFENIGRCLALAGAKFSDIVKINYYVTDMANTAELRRIRAQYLNMDAPPASTLVQAGLGKGLLLEVEAIAIVPE
ncbi:MAG: RidA family protein [Gammaproteobacteria bacterium]